MQTRPKKIKRPKVVSKKKKKSYLTPMVLEDEDLGEKIQNTFFESSKHGGLLERPLLYKFDFKNSMFYGYDIIKTEWFSVRLGLKNVSAIVIKGEFKQFSYI